MTESENAMKWSLTSEPAGESYRSLLNYAARRQSVGLVVLRDEQALLDSGTQFLKRLEPFVLEIRRGEEWPGTKLLSGSARIIRFIINDQVARLLGETTSHLFEWLQPTLPEDLCFVDGGRPWLISTSHERDASLVLEPRAMKELNIAVPGLLVSLEIDSIGIPQ